MLLQGNINGTRGDVALLIKVLLFGQGGKITDENRDQLLLGTGVIGVGGDAGNMDMPPASDAGSVGVFGQGADANVKTIVDDGSTVFDGPAEPGAGVIGRGGVGTGVRPGVAAGVIGLAGGHAKPSIAETGSTGVRGRGFKSCRARQSNQRACSNAALLISGAA